MKKAFLLLIVVLLIGSTVSASAVEQPDTILFRSIPWFENRASVRTTMSNIDGIQPGYGSSDMARIDTWYRQWNNMYADPNITDGGAMSAYKNLKVAGYSASVTLSFVFPIVDGKVLYSADNAQFYKAIYKLDELEDMPAAFDDLTTKLSSLYGTPEDKSYYNSFAGLDTPKAWLWYAKDGSLVFLAMYYDTYSKKYDEVWITYAAPKTDELLNTLIAQIKQEAIEAEEAERLKNSTNTDGL